MPNKNNIKFTNTNLNVRRNERIKAWNIRVIDFNSKQVGVLNKSSIIRFSYKIKLDLVEITAKSLVPVCKLVNYGKYLYRLNKKLKKNKSTFNRFKEVRFKVNIGERDLLIKLKRCAHFLAKEKKLKISIFLKGKFSDKKESSLQLLNFCVKDLSNLGKSEGIKVLGRSAQVFINPKLKKNT